MFNLLLICPLAEAYIIKGPDLGRPEPPIGVTPAILGAHLR